MREGFNVYLLCLGRGEGEGGSYVSLLCWGEVRVRGELCIFAVLGRGEGEGGSYVYLLCWGEVRVREGVMYLCCVGER